MNLEEYLTKHPSNEFYVHVVEGGFKVWIDGEKEEFIPSTVEDSD